MSTVMNHEEQFKQGLMLRPKDALADWIIELTEYCNKETARADKEKGWGEAQGLLRNAAVKLKDKEIAALKEQNTELLAALEIARAYVESYFESPEHKEPNGDLVFIESVLAKATGENAQ